MDESKYYYDSTEKNTWTHQKKKKNVINKPHHYKLNNVSKSWNPVNE